jgi:Cro/C1-type HTH DNA-binding domain
MQLKGQVGCTSYRAFRCNGECFLFLLYSHINNNIKAKAIRLSTLEAICKALDCQPGDLLEYKSEEGTQGE